MSAVVRRAIAVLYLLANVSELMKQAKAIVTAMTNNAFFVSPTPTLAAVTAAIAQLDLAEIAAKGKAVGAAKARDVKKAVLIKLLRELQFFVQGIADSMPDQGAAIIVSAGMSVRKLTPRQRNQDEARQGDVSGLVLLIATVVDAPKVVYFWEMSTDQKIWTSLPMAFESTTSVHGLTPATTYFFRYHTVSKKFGTSDLSQILSLLVK